MGSTSMPVVGRHLHGSVVIPSLNWNLSGIIYFIDLCLREDDRKELPDQCVMTISRWQYDYLCAFCYYNTMQQRLRGYTLIELLTVIGILSVISSIVLSVVFMSLTGSKKSDTVETLRQNGDTALTQMVKAIRYAKSLDFPSSCTTPVTTSSIQISSLSDSGQTTYTCNGTTIASNSASLLNTAVVKTQSCNFTCSQQSLGSAPTITIRYTLVPVSGTSLVETKATLPFQSTVTMRNYSR